MMASRKLTVRNKARFMDIQSYFDHRTGMFQWRKKCCMTCQFISHGKSTFSDRSGNILTIKQFIKCSSEFIVYVFRCPCDLLCVAQNTHTLQKRVGDHRKLIQKGSVKHGVLQIFFFCLITTKTLNVSKVLTIEYISDRTLTENEKVFPTM